MSNSFITLSPNFWDDPHPPSLKLTPAQYYEFVCQNPDLQIEQNANGEIEIMPPTGAGSSDRNAEINMQLRLWAKAHKNGKTFDSNGQFRLPNGAARSPAASWLRKSRWDALSQDEKEAFSPLCPDFVIELRSKSDRMPALKTKMEEYMANGAQLGWLIDPYSKAVHIFRLNSAVEILDNPATVSGEEVLPGFVLQLADVFAEL